MELQHFSHPHPLLLSLDGSIVDDDDYLCDLCWERVSSGTPCYGCKDDGCDIHFYILHKSCAELPHQLKHPFHHKHDPLTLSKSTYTKSKEDYPSCDNCGRYQSYPRFAYNCSGCKFNLCIKCASLSLTTKVDIHDHPLTLMRKSTQFICDHCEKEGKGMFYFCATCSFAVHLECTLLPLVVRPLIIEAEIHDHPLTLARKLISFSTCDACGKDGRGMFYICAECSFVVHQECASLPSVVKVIRHDHPLNLIYSLPAIDPSNLHRRVCQLCVKMEDIDYGVYYCSSCDYVAHLHCATSKEEKDETFMRKSKDEESIESSTSLLEHGIDESTDMLPYVVKKFKPGVDGIEIAAEIIHFSYEHDLKLTDKFGIKEKCDACTRYIFTPYYACAQCRFFFHISCAELRRAMRHPLHRHPLMLLPRTTYSTGSFVCDACRRDSCNGFTYNCEECEFNIDVQCSLLPYNKFTHDSHEHGLIFSRLPEGRKCNNCDSDEEIQFCCADNCGFALDFECLTLPHTVWFEQHEHPFTLCYAPKDDSGEYYCDICEEERDPRCWFYYYADCIYPAHPECLLGEFPNIKFGKTFIIDNHQHPLAFVQKTSDDGRDLCKVCPYGFRDQDLAYECAECNFIVHEWCLRRIGTSKG